MGSLYVASGAIMFLTKGASSFDDVKNKQTALDTLLLLLLSHFSRVRLCTTPEMAAHQASPTLGLSRQEHWSGVPFPSPMHESEVAQSCPYSNVFKDNS